MASTAASLGIKQFIEKVREGDIDAIRSNIRAHGFPRNSRAYTDYKALQTALAYDRIEIAKLLISEGCRINPESQRPSDPTPLHLAVIHLNVEVATMLLERNVNPYTKTEFWGRITTVLHVAVREELTCMMELILTYNVNVNEPDDFGETALQLLIMIMQNYPSGSMSLNTLRIKMFQLLLSHGAALDLNQLDSEGNTVLWWFIMKNCSKFFITKDQVKVIHLLLSNGATLDLNKLDSWGNTVLHRLLQNSSDFADDDDYLAVFGCIPSLNIVVDRQNFDGKTLLHLAAENRQQQVLDIMLPLATSVDTKDTRGDTPLHSYLGGFLNSCTDSCDLNFATVKILLKKGASVEVQNNQGVAPIHLAMALKNRDIAMKFLEHINNADLCDNKNRSLLNFLAGTPYVFRYPYYEYIEMHNCTSTYPIIYAESPEIARMILTKNATIDLCDDYRCTPFHTAVISRQSDLVRFLLEQGANVNAVTVNGDTPLHLLTDTANDEIKDVDMRMIDILVARGVNLEIVNDGNMSALCKVAYNRQLRMMLVLLGHCCKKVVMLKDQHDNTALHLILASFSGNAVETELYVEITNQFLSKAGDCLVNIPNKEGMTLLHLAVQYKHFEVMQLLLLKGADPMLCDRDGNTILHFLVRPVIYYRGDYVEDTILQSKIEQMVEMLIKRRSLVNARNKDGRTPLHVLFSRNRLYDGLCMLQMVRLFLKHGADPDAQDLSGNTALHLADGYLYFRTRICESVDEVLNYGADINVLNALGHTALSNCKHSSVEKILANNAQKLREAHLPLVQANFIALEQLNMGSSSLYAEELLEMKRYQLSERITVADVLRMPVSRLAVYTANLKLRQLIFESEEFALQFPHYLNLIRANFRKGFIRSNLIGSAKLALDGLCRFAWPYICSEMILENLSNENLRNLIEASQLKIECKSFFNELDEEDVRPTKRLKSDDM